MLGKFSIVQRMKSSSSALAHASAILWPMSKQRTNIAKNRKAFHDYFVDDTYECGIVLTGTEVCSLRENSCQLRDCYAMVRKGEVWMHGVHIAPYSHGNVWNVDTERARKLLLHK